MSSNVTLSTEVELEKFKAVSASDSVSRYGRYWELIFGTIFFVAAVIGYAAYQSGSLERALPYLTGQRFFVSETQIDLGKVRCQAEVDAPVTYCASLGISCTNTALCTCGDDEDEPCACMNSGYNSCTCLGLGT